MARGRTLTREVVLAARREARGKPWGAIAALEKKYGCKLWRAIRGDTFKDLNDEEPPVRESAPRFAATGPLEEKVLLEARRLFRNGVPFTYIARCLGVTTQRLERCIVHAFLTAKSGGRAVESPAVEANGAAAP